ncbi:carboxymuconolactone decarboxylase family protein [Clostridium chromiireducens]|uniref:Carboxymuconolactone decarboxylase family protein n=1 Tax=Clostridium chromiireducens TaxID=225345 RepID=A0A399IR83_9CLOT|nr:carboxymuconolactone decarboxylase family protein [Clostridium chromiireducens]RII35521.1 carboxymuconolactone decarboxylase family protein [Clostridium chromiireducens]
MQDKKVNAFINPPKKIPWFLKIGIYISNKVTKKDLLVPKLLAWYPKVAISSGILEAMVAHGKGDLNKRILKLVRIQASLSVSCPFCIDMNSFEYEEEGITKEEIYCLTGKYNINDVSTFNIKEKLAIEYTKFISQTPIKVPKEFMEKVKLSFTEREIVIIASTVAQVNYWARLIQALGVPPAGFSNKCDI